MFLFKVAFCLGVLYAVQMNTKRVIAVPLLLMVICGAVFGVEEDVREWFGNDLEKPPTEPPPSMEELQREFLEQGAKYFQTMRILALVGVTLGLLIALGIGPRTDAPAGL